MINLRKSFTLLELVLYVFAFSIIGLALYNFSTMAFRASAYSKAVAEVELQGSAIMLKLIKAINNVAAFDGINAPAVGTATATLSLKTATTSTNPTLFTLSNGVITMKEGASSTISLSSNLVLASDLVFTNFGRPLTDAGVVQIKFKLSFNNQGTNRDFDYSRDFVSAANPLLR